MCLGIPGKLEAIEGDDPLFRTGKVNFGGVLKDVSLAAVPEVLVGQYVIVHAGMAISILDEAEADEVFQYLNELAQGYEEVGNTASLPPEYAPESG